MTARVPVILMLQVKPTIAYPSPWEFSADRDGHFILMYRDHSNMICHDPPWPLLHYQYYITCVTKCPQSHIICHCDWIFCGIFWILFIIYDLASVQNNKKKTSKFKQEEACELISAADIESLMVSLVTAAVGLQIFVFFPPSLPGNSSLPEYWGRLFIYAHLDTHTRCM